MIAVTGANGQVGSAFMRMLPNAVGLTRSEVDLSDPGALRRSLDKLSCETLVNCAAYTAVDNAETDEPAATLVNADSVGIMADWAVTRSVRFVTFSTDYVFDGSKVGPYVESDAPNPQSAYGRTKLAGEQLANQANPEALIVRTAWVISGTHPNFVATILRLAREKEISVVNDQHGSPTIADDLARHTMQLVEAGAAGVVHATNPGATTWYGLARAAVELGGLDVGRIAPCSTADFPRPAPRPANSLLASERYEQIGAMPNWHDSLPAVIERILTWL